MTRRLGAERLAGLLLSGWLLVAVGSAGCESTDRELEDATDSGNDGTGPAEVEIVEIPLPEGVNGAEAEYSGLAWLGDRLILLPQYPSLFSSQIVALKKASLLSYLDGVSASALSATMIAFEDGGIASSISGFQGFEAIAFQGSKAFLTVEASDAGAMACHVITGEVAADGSALALDVASLRPIAPQASLENLCDEALLVHGDRVLTFYEANGANVNPAPFAHEFDLQLVPTRQLPMPQIEYRVTDVTAPDAAGRFFAINYFYPDDAGVLNPSPDPLAESYGLGATHSTSTRVERLVEFVITDDAVELVDRAPLALALAPTHSRNWEGIVRLDDRGFLLVTDKFPSSLLAFVPFPPR